MTMNETKTAKNLNTVIKNNATIIAGVLIIIIFAVASGGTSISLQNIINVTRQIAPLGVIAIGATFVMAVDEFDLAIGAIASLGGLLAARFAELGLPLWASFTVPLVIGFIIGFVNGFIVARFRVLSFITTLGMSTVIGGLAYWLTNGASINVNLPAGFNFFSRAIGRVPLQTIILFLVALACWFVMRHTTFGRKTYAIGGNQQAAGVSGIRVEEVKIIAYALCALLAVFAGILTVSRNVSATPTSGDGLFLQAYAAVFLGKTMFKNGVPNVWGTVVGAAILGVLSNGLTILAAPKFLTDLLTGAIIVIAVVAPKVSKKSRLS